MYLTVRHQSHVCFNECQSGLPVLILYFVNRLSYKMSLIMLRGVDSLKDWRTGWRHSWVLRLWLLLIIILLVKIVLKSILRIVWSRAYSIKGNLSQEKKRFSKSFDSFLLRLKCSLVCLNYLQLCELYLHVWIKIDKYNLLVILHVPGFAKMQQMYALSFITLLQMTPKNMLKYFQTLKGWISFRIITSDAIRLVIA